MAVVSIGFTHDVEEWSWANSILVASYGGFLAVSARIRYPDTFYGAIASSPALNSFGPLSSNQAKFDSAKWASQVYNNASKDASSKIKTSMLTFKKCLAGETLAYEPCLLYRLTRGRRYLRGDYP